MSAFADEVSSALPVTAFVKTSETVIIKAIRTQKILSLSRLLSFTI
jgi:hypothetical protein